MSIVAVALVLTALVGLLIRTNSLGFGSALVCVLLGLVVASTPAGPTVTSAVNQAGTWTWTQVNSL